MRASPIFKSELFRLGICLLLGSFFLQAEIRAAKSTKKTEYEKDPVSGLASIPGCTYIETDWADGDSFLVKFPNGKKQTVRLYGADCIESAVRDTADAQRLRTQRRYFGISGKKPSESIAQAKEFGKQAALFTKEQLMKGPFTIHTSFADGRGSAKYSRIYAFVTLEDGSDLAELLVKNGQARAYGVSRRTPYGEDQDGYRQRLADTELVAAKNSRGVWAKTDWDSLPKERQAERREQAELALAHDGAAQPLKESSINPNNASRDELMQLPSVGETLATRIIEAREDGEFLQAQDLVRVKGVGPALVEKIQPYLIFEP